VAVWQSCWLRWGGDCRIHTTICTLCRGWHAKWQLSYGVRPRPLRLGWWLGGCGVNPVPYGDAAVVGFAMHRLVNVLLARGALRLLAPFAERCCACTC